MKRAILLLLLLYLLLENMVRRIRMYLKAQYTEHDWTTFVVVSNQSDTMCARH